MDDNNKDDLWIPGAGSLISQLDKKCLIVLRDGRHIVGVLRSFDQFGNIIISDCVERRFINGMYADIPLGLYILRGDAMVMLGEIDEEREQNNPNFRKVTINEILEEQAKLNEVDYTVEEQLEWNFDI